MPKNKKPVPRKSSSAPQEDDEVLAQQLADLALDIAEQEHLDEGDATAPSKEEEFARLMRNAFRKKNDELLYDAVERARYADVGAYQYLRAQIEEAAATLMLRREGAPAMEVNAFAVPLFVHSTGGLKEAEGFQDGDAFGALVDSFVQAGLESPKAKVVLISHAYDPEEASRITYTQLNDMARDAAAAMSDKKLVATPALEASIVGWEASSFGPGDKAVELRFLLGFALKRADDPFYQAPPGEEAADIYFEDRMARYRAWTAQAAPLIKRCLGPDPAALDVHFLYQDLFFGAREQGMAELAMLQMMADINAALQQHGADAGALQALAGPADIDGEMVLRVQLRDAAGSVLATSEKPLDLAADLQGEVDDICDALATLGIEQVSVALKFGHDGVPLEVQPYQERRA